LSYKLSKPGILLTQPMNLVVIFAATTRRPILLKGIFKQRQSLVGRLISPKRGFTAASLAPLRMVCLHD
jgi:hypothetical protein